MLEKRLKRWKETPAVAGAWGEGRLSLDLEMKMRTDFLLREVMMAVGLRETDSH